MDNVDWKKIRAKEDGAKVAKEGGGEEDDNEDDDDDDDDDENDLEDYTPSVIGWKEKIPLYEEIISLMLPGAASSMLRLDRTV